MAKRIVDEEMRFSIIVNGNQAQKELFDLEKSTRKLTATNKELRAEQARLVGQGKKGTEAYKRITAEIKQNNAVIKANKAQMKTLQKQIGVTGLTMGQLTKRATQLKLELRNMVPGSAQYKKLQAELKTTTLRINELKGAARASKLSIASIADGVTRYAALGASVIATLTGVIFSIQRMLDYNGQLSDSLANVRKTTGLTNEEVNQLGASLSSIRTRTSRMELLKLAEEAGRLGITGVKNIKDFVEVANEMKVALGDDLSDTQIREVGKLAKIYKVGERTGRDYKNSLLSIGSAINEVSASGANTAGFLVEYMKRQAGVAAQTNVSAEDNIAYAATFDEIGQSVEVSATAMNKIWIDMFSNTSEYAKIAGMDLQEFSNLLNTDANQAMITFLKGLDGNNEGLQVMVKKIDELEAGGTRGVQALLALAKNTELLEKRQVTSNKALNEAVSLTNEYRLKNNNLAATLDKIKKKTLGWFSSDGLVSFLTAAANGFAKLIGATEDSTKALEDERMEVLRLESRIKDINTTQEQRVKLIKEFQAQYPGYLSNLDAEKVSNEQLRNAIREVNDQLVMKIALQIKEEEILEQANITAERFIDFQNKKKEVENRMLELAEKHNIILKENTTIEERAQDVIKQIGISAGVAVDPVAKLSHELNNLKIVETDYKRLDSITKTLQAARDNLANEIGLNDEPAKNTNTGSTVADIDPTITSTNITSSKTVKSAQKTADDLLKIQRDAEDAKLEVMQESFDKQMLLEDFNHYRKIEDLQNKLIDQKTIDKAANENMRKSYLDFNKAIYSQIESEDQLHEIRKATIIEKGLDNQIQLKQQQFEREADERLTAHLNEVAALGSNEEAKEKLREEFDEQELKRTKEHYEFLKSEIKKILSDQNFEGFDLSKLSADQIQKIKDNLRDLGLSIAEINELLAEMQGKGSGGLDFATEVDVLGFSIDQWESTFEKLETVEQKIRTAEMGVKAFMNAWGMYHQFVSQKQQKELQEFERNSERRKEKQSQLLEQGFINKRQHDEAVQGIEEETERKRAEMEYNAAKRQKEMSVAGAIMNTAVGVSKALAQGGFVLGVPWAAIVGALGAIQIGLAASAPLPAKGFEDGYYNIQREQDGKLFNAAYGGESSTGLVDKPTLFLAGEGGRNFPEMIIDGASFKQMSPIVKEALYGELARVKGFERGFVSSQTAPVAFNNESSTQTNTTDPLLTATLIRTNELLEKLEKEGVTALMDKSFRNLKKLREEMDKYDKLKQKNIR